MNKDDVFIDSIGLLKEKLEQDHSIVAGPTEISTVLRKDLRMRYKLVKPIAWQSNSVKSLLVRQKFALAFLEIDLDKKIVINIDETWLGMSDFRRRKGRPHRHINSVAQLQL